jgi:DNA-binding helix-hairpin-helix protein with protein kinase domain
MGHWRTRADESSSQSYGACGMPDMCARFAHCFGALASLAGGRMRPPLREWRGAVAQGRLELRSCPFVAHHAVANHGELECEHRG